MQVFAPQQIGEKEIETARQSLAENKPLRVVLYNYYNCIDSNDWDEFASIINQNTYLQFELGLRLEQDSDGNFYKSWGELSFLQDLSHTARFVLHAHADHLDNLQYFKSLKEFSIENRGQRMDLNPLLQFKDSLEKLSLEGNLKHIEIAKEFTKLKYLSLHAGIKKFDFEWLRNMPALETLTFVRGIDFINAEIFRDLHSIKHLGVHFNPKLVSLSFIEQSKSLETLSVTSSGNFTQMPNLSALNNLHHIGLETTGRIQNLSEIKNAPSLKSFAYWWPKNQPEDFAFLKELQLEKCQIVFNSDKNNRLVEQYLQST